MEKTAFELQNTMSEIDIACDKILAVINNLLDSYETRESIQPSIRYLTSDCINSKADTSGRNTFSFVQGYNEIMQFIRIIFDYVCDISKAARIAIGIEP